MEAAGITSHWTKDVIATRMKATREAARTQQAAPGDQQEAMGDTLQVKVTSISVSLMLSHPVVKAIWLRHRPGTSEDARLAQILATQI